MPWTQAEEQELTALVARGLSAGQIAKEMHKTRSAVIGKIGRTPGLQLHTSGMGGVSRGTRRHPGKMDLPRFAADQPTYSKLPLPDGCANVPLLEHREGQCRWPIGEMRCCGLPIAQERRPYCDYHARASSSGERS